MAIFLFLTAWTIGAFYVVVGNYLYFAKVLPGLARDGLDGSPKFLPWKQLRQVDLFFARFAPDAPRPWFHGVLSHARGITVVVLLMVALAVPAFLGL